MVTGSANNDGQLSARVRRREKFKDGSELIEFEGGSLLICESGFCPEILLAEQPAPYGAPAPKPVRKG